MDWINAPELERIEEGGQRELRVNGELKAGVVEETERKEGGTRAMS